jgi:hypothetical protein
MNHPKTNQSLVWRACLAAILSMCALATQRAAAQSVVVTPYTLNYWAGVNTSKVLGSGSNAVTISGSPGTVTFSLSGASGVTPTFSPASTNATSGLNLQLACTNATAGANSLTISATGGASYSTNVNLFVIPMWNSTNSGSSGTWATGGNWSSGTTLNGGGSDSVLFEKMIATPWTNVVAASQTIQDLVYLADADDSSTANGLNTTINSGQTLSVLGTNGFLMAHKTVSGSRPFFKFEGAGALLVSNPVANFGVLDGEPNGTRYFTVNMTNLNNLTVYVKRVGVGDSSMNGLVGPYNQAQQVALLLAKTNLITAYGTDNYYGLNWNAAIQYERSDVSINGSQACQFNLGVSNGIYADSIAIGHGNNVGSGSTAFGILAYPLRFTPVFTNETAPFATAVFRNTNGGRMSLLALGVDNGPANLGQAANNRGMADFRGGNVDMLVDQIWLGANRTNAGPAVKDDQGGLYFDWGKINANTIIAGNQLYTNFTQPIIGYVLVGTNGTLNVNSNLALGMTLSGAGAVAGFEGVAAAVSGQVQINNGGTLRASKITVGQYSSNNVVTVNVGGSLVVSNTIADISKGLTTLSLDGATLTFSVVAGLTNAYVTNLNTTTTASKINIASAPAGQSTNVLIVYQAANQTPNISIGTLPAGFNNMQIVVDNTAKTVSLVVSTNQPKNLAWRGGANANWDHSSLNWLDTNTLAITKFTDGDKVTFDDTTGVPLTINVVDNVNPGQSGNGITVANTTNQFTFANGGGSIGTCALVKSGTNNLAIDCTSSVSAQLNAGRLTIDAGGSAGNVTTVAGTTLTIGGTGAVSGGITGAGVVQNSGVVFGSLTLQTGASASNSGILSNTVSMQTGTTLNNSGSMTAAGNLTVTTNSTLNNSGTIYGSTLTVNVGGTLVDTVPGTAANSAGSINVVKLDVFGAFYPGGLNTAVATTKITDYDYSSGSGLGNPNGRLQLEPGSTTVLRYNSTNAQTYSKVLAFSDVFGHSVSAKGIAGCTLLVSNVGPGSLTAGTSLKFFGNYINDTVLGNGGLNTTNDYPIMVPAVPGSGLVWDMSQLYVNGTISVVNASTYQIAVTNNVTILGGTNIVMELSWDPSLTGYGWLQQQIGTLTNGLGTNWNNVGSSDYVNDIFLTNTVSAGSTIYYRFVKP